MNKKIQGYYNALKVLRVAQADLQAIKHLEDAYNNYERYSSVNTLSYALTTYKREIDEIGKYTGVGDVNTSEELEPIEMYDQGNISDSKIKNDIIYARDCLIIIFAVKNFMAPSIEDAMKYVLS